VTGNHRPEAEQLVAFANGVQEATSHRERGGDNWRPARRLELCAGAGSSDANNTTTNLGEPGQSAQSMCDNGVKDFPDPTADRLLRDASRIPAAAGKSDQNIPGFHAAADKCTAIYSSALGLRCQ
jgi:hypothetical protein